DGQSAKFAVGVPPGPSLKPGTTMPGFAATAWLTAVTSWKSTLLKRGDFMSACDQPPPSTCGMVLTSSFKPATVESLVRNVRGWRSGAGLSQPRDSYLTSSLLCCGRGGVSDSPRPGHGLKPASSTSTFWPACVSAHAALLPPGPLPMMQTSKVEREVLPRTSGVVAMVCLSNARRKRTP